MVESGVTLLLALLTLAAAGPLQRLPREAEDYQSMDPYTNFTANEVCFSDNEVFQKGDLVPNPGPCEECRCEPPSIVCNMVKCPVNTNGCRTIQRPNQCCAEYLCECEYNGQTYSDGERIDMPEEPCQVCYCKGGDVMCTSITCYTRDDCEPLVVPGQCCPKYENCPLRDMDATKVDRNGLSTKASNHSINKEMQPWLLTKLSPQTPSSPSPKQDSAADHTTEDGNIIIVSDWLTERRTTAKDVAGGPGIMIFDPTERPSIVTDANEHTVTQLENVNTESIHGGVFLKNSETAAPVEEVIFTRIDMLRGNKDDSILLSTSLPFLENAETTKNSYVNSDGSFSSTLSIIKELTSTPSLQNSIDNLKLEENKFNTNISQDNIILRSKEMLNNTVHNSLVTSALPIVTTSATTGTGVNMSNRVMNNEEKVLGALNVLKASTTKEFDEDMTTGFVTTTDTISADETTISNLHDSYSKYSTLNSDTKSGTDVHFNTEGDSTVTIDYRNFKIDETTIQPNDNLKYYLKTNDDILENNKHQASSENTNQIENSTTHRLETEGIYSTPSITTTKSQYLSDVDETTSTSVTDDQINEINATPNKYVKCYSLECDNEAVSDVTYRVETTTDFEEITTTEIETETTYYENLNLKNESETSASNSSNYNTNGSEEEYSIEGETFSTETSTPNILDSLEIFNINKQNGDKIDRNVLLEAEPRNSGSSNTLVITVSNSSESDMGRNRITFDSSDDESKFSIEEVVANSSSNTQYILQNVPETFKNKEVTTSMPALMETVGYIMNQEDKNKFEDLNDRSETNDTLLKISLEDSINKSIYDVSDVPPVLDLNSHVPFLQLGGHSIAESSSNFPEVSDSTSSTKLQDERGPLENQDSLNIETSTKKVTNLEVTSAFHTTSSPSFGREIVEAQSDVRSNEAQNERINTQNIWSSILSTSPIPLTPSDLKALAEILISGKIQSLNQKSDTEPTTNQWLIGNLTSESNLASILDAANVTVGIMVKPYSINTKNEVDPIIHNTTKVDKFEKDSIYKKNSIFRNKNIARNRTGYLHDKTNGNRILPKSSYKEHTEAIAETTTNRPSLTESVPYFHIYSPNLEESTKNNNALVLNVSESYSDSIMNIEKMNVSHKLEERFDKNKLRKNSAIVNVTSGTSRPSVDNDTSQSHTMKQNSHDQLSAISSTYTDYNMETNKESTRSPFSFEDQALTQTTASTSTKDTSQNIETIP